MTADHLAEDFDPRSVGRSGGRRERLSRLAAFTLLVLLAGGCFAGHYGLTTKHTIRCQSSGIVGVSFSPDAKALATASITAQLWDPSTGRELGFTGGGAKADIVSITFSPDGAIVAGGTQAGTVVLWERSTSRTLAVLAGDDGVSHPVKFSPDGKKVAAGGHGAVTVWDVAGKESKMYKRIDLFVKGLDFSPDGKTLAFSGGVDQGMLYLLDLATFGCMAAVRSPGGLINSVEFSPDGKSLATGDVRGSVRIWDPATLRELAVLGESEHGVSSVAYSADGRLLAAGYDGTPDGASTVQLWDVTAKRVIAESEAVDQGIASLALSPDGKFIAIGRYDGTVILWALLKRGTRD